MTKFQPHYLQLEAFIFLDTLKFFVILNFFFQHFELRGSPSLMEKVSETNLMNAFIFLIF